MVRSYSRSLSPRRRRRTYSRSLSPPDEDGYRVHISDLGLDCRKRELEHTFEKFGPLIELWLARNPPCFAFAVYRNREDAADAIDELDGRMVCGKRVRVSWAKPRTRGMGRGFDPNMRCYQCGEKGHFSRDCTGDRRMSRPMRRSFSRSRSRSPRRRRSRSPRERRRHFSSENRSPDPRYSRAGYD